MGHDRVRAILCAKELSGEDMKKYLGLNFLIYGYRDVGEYLELVHEHRALLQELVYISILKYRVACHTSVERA